MMLGMLPLVSPSTTAAEVVLDEVTSEMETSDSAILAAIGKKVAQKALELGIRGACKVSTELAAQAEDDDAAIVLSSFINLVVMDGTGSTVSKISKMCEDILAELAELDEDVEDYTAAISSAIDKQNTGEVETQYDLKWASDVTQVLLNCNVNGALDQYLKYLIITHLNTNGAPEGEGFDTLEAFWCKKFKDTALTSADYSDSALETAKTELETAFLEIYDPDGGANSRDAAYRSAHISNVMTNAIGQLVYNYNHSSVGDNSYRVIDCAATDAYYTLPFAHQQYGFVNAAARKQIMIVSLMQMALNEYLAMQGEYLASQDLDDDWNETLGLTYTTAADTTASMTYDQCKEKYVSLLNSSLEAAGIMLDSEIRINATAYTGSTEDITLNMSNYMPAEDATLVKLTIQGYAKDYDYLKEINATEAGYSMTMGDTVSSADYVTAEMLFYRVMAGGKVYYILDPAQFEGTDALDVHIFREHIKRYGPAGGSDKLYGDLYPVSNDYRNLIKTFSDGANSFDVPTATDMTDRFAALVKMPSFSAYCAFSLQEHLKGYLPTGATGSTYILTSSYSNRFNVGTNTEVKSAEIQLVDVADTLDNTYTFETSTVNMESVEDNTHKYTLILANASDVYYQNATITSDAADTLDDYYIQYSNGAKKLSGESTAKIESGTEITIKFKINDPANFDSLVLVRHNAEDTQTVLLDGKDLLNLETDSAGYYSFTTTMPYSEAEFIINCGEPEQDAYGIYEIYTVEHLRWFENQVNVLGNTSISGKLMADIDVNPGYTFNADGTVTYAGSTVTSGWDSWTPLGSADGPFSGKLYGNDKTISGLYVNTPNADCVGLFGYSTDAIFRVTVENSYFSGASYVGGIAGKSEGTLQYCTNAATVVGTGSYVGGVAGLSSSSYVFAENFNYGDVTGDTYVGGVAGSSERYILDCGNVGDVTGNSIVGGIAGRQDHNVKYCYSYGTINCAGANEGAIVGQFDPTGYVVNTCFYLSGTASGGIDGVDSDGSAEPRTLEQFASGEVTFSLSDRTDDPWGQAIDVDPYPVLNGPTVYVMTDCTGTALTFSNVQGADASCNYNEEGFCRVCGGYQPAELVDDYYLIYNAGQLFYFAERANENYLACGKLMADIDVNPGYDFKQDGTVTYNGQTVTEGWREWPVIRGNCDTEPDVFYEGTIDGNNKTISGLWQADIYRQLSLMGLVGFMGGSGCVHDLSVVNSYFEGYCYVGGIAGTNTGTIERCYFEGGVDGKTDVGGIAGSNDGNYIRDCYATAHVSADSMNAGGITGSNSNDGVQNCYFNGTLGGAATPLVGEHPLTPGADPAVNSYYLSDAETEDGGKTAAQFASGEVAYLLNGSTSEGTLVWGQTIGEDLYPVLNGPTVYLAVDCDGVPMDGYTNTQNDTSGHQGEPVYVWTLLDEKECHVSAELTCTVCGKSDSVADLAQLVEETSGTDCQDPGTATYSFTATLLGKEYTATKTFVTEVIDHPSFTDEGFCEVCGGYQPAVLDSGEYAEQEADELYLIYNAGQLYWFADQANNVNNCIDGKLMNDIDVNPNYAFSSDGSATYKGYSVTRGWRKWTPIGTYDDDLTVFTGFFYGNSKTVSGLYVNDYASNEIGFFGRVGYNPTISDLGITNCYFRGNESVGAVCGYGEVTLERVYVTESVTVVGYNFVGGMIGWTNGGDLQNCYSHAYVVGEQDLGGLVGKNYNNITNCYTSGYSLVGSHNTYYGSVITNSYYSSTSETEDGGKSVEQFASGEVAYLLQAGVAAVDVYDENGNWVDSYIPEIWGQTIGTDEHPVLNGPKVYQNQIVACTGEVGSYEYSNTQADPVVTHSWVDATCTTAKVCSACGATEGEALGHIDVDPIDHRCDRCNCLMKPAVLTFCSISLKGNIAINYYMLLSDEVLADETAYMQFTMVDGEVIQIPVSEGIETLYSGETYYVFTCTVNAKEMTDDVKSDFFYTGGSAGEYTYNVKKYADYILANSTNEELKDLVTAMLHYGGASQTHFEYNTDDLANADLTAPDYSGVTIDGFEGITDQGTELASFYSASLLLKSETILRFFFQLDASVENFTATYNGQQLTVLERGGLYYVDVTGISAKDLDADVTVTISDGISTADVTYNPMTYCATVLNDTTGTYDQDMQNVVKALYLYNQAANIYFEEN